MKNEIKEILEDIKQWVDSPLDEIDKKYGIWELSYNQSKTLLDYITNLQEENERLKKSITDIVQQNIYNSFEKDVYKTRNEKAIEKLKYYSGGEAEYYVPFEDIINILQGKSDE